MKLKLADKNVKIHVVCLTLRVVTVTSLSFEFYRQHLSEYDNIKSPDTEHSTHMCIVCIGCVFSVQFLWPSNSSCLDVTYLIST